MLTIVSRIGIKTHNESQIDLLLKRLAASFCKYLIYRVLSVVHISKLQRH